MKKGGQDTIKESDWRIFWEMRKIKNFSSEDFDYFNYKMRFVSYLIIDLIQSKLIQQCKEPT